MLTRFYKELNQWYIDLPSYPGDKADLQMVLGADLFLDFLSKQTNEVYIELSKTNSFLPNILHLIELADDIGNGAYYEWFYNEPNSGFGDFPKCFKMWLCDVTKFVFDGQFPDQIYFKLKQKENKNE